MIPSYTPGGYLLYEGIIYPMRVFVNPKKRV